MCNVRMIRTEPGLVSIPVKEAVYCVFSARVRDAV